MKYIAVLMTVFNRKDTTLRCLRELKKQEIPEGCNLDVYMTDDGCTDGTSEAVTAEFPDVHIIKGDGTLYWNRGMIAAWEEAARQKDYDFYLWLNDDTILFPNAIKNIILNSEHLNDKALLVGTTVGESFDEYTYGGRNHNRKIVAPDKNKPVPCRLINGNFVLIPKYVYDILGTNDSCYMHSRGDFDYSLRAANHGIEVYVIPGVIGQCERHDHTAKWFDASLPLADRLYYLKSKYGFNVAEEFMFRRRHYGFFNAFQHHLRNYMHALCPSVLKYWGKR